MLSLGAEMGQTSSLDNRLLPKAGWLQPLNKPGPLLSTACAFCEGEVGIGSMARLAGMCSLQKVAKSRSRQHNRQHAAAV